MRPAPSLLVALLPALFQLACAVVRQPEVDRILERQRVSIINGASIGLRGNKVDDSLLNRAFFDRHGNGVLERATPKVRKEYRCLLPSERDNLHAALRTLKTTKPVGATLTHYDAFIAQHDRASAPGAHFGPAFGPWHRHYLYTFEVLLQTVCPSCALVYWDTRLDGRLGGNPRSSVIFSSRLAGNPVGPVTTGFAANWTSPGLVCAGIFPTLRRNVITNVFSYYDDGDVQFPERVLSHREISHPWDDTFETTHGYVHTSFGQGSHMTSLLCSPCDPMFIMHHTFIDNMFERARTNIKQSTNGLYYVNVNDLPSGFVDTGGIVRVFSAPNATMLPFRGIINSDGLLNDDYTNSWYRYEKSPGDVACSSDADCCANGNVEFVWCDRTTRRCLSKVNEGGSISSNLPGRACYCPPGRQPFIQSSTCRCR